ncbi:hypothetical protein QOZ80_4AG0324090 [Eleusine coracana subsp. coracana]|nr:hypothetical protein QOZ80_4AG0324090 [Eleusine coracana subsp. coracana]
MVFCDKVKLIVSYGGEIRRCPISGKPRYVGGENRLVKVGLSERLAGLRARLAALAGYSAVRIQYAIVEEGLDALHDVDSDADLWRLVTLLYYRAAGVAAKDCRVRAFLHPIVDDTAPPPQPSSLKVPPPVACLQHSASSPVLLPDVHDDVVASLMRAQSDGDVYMAGSSTSLTRADSGFEALAAIAEEQKNPSSTTSQQADSGPEAFAAVATEQKLRASPAPVILVPVAPIVTVFYFYPVIPVHTCLVLTGLQTVAARV